MPIKQPHTAWSSGGRKGRRVSAEVRGGRSNARQVSLQSRRAGTATNTDRNGLDKQIQRWEDDGGAGAKAHREAEKKSWGVWTPPAMYARLCAQDALEDIPRAWGIYAEGSSTLTRIVWQVDRRLLAPEIATERLRQLAGRLLLYRQAVDAIHDGRDRAAMSQRRRFGP